MDEYIIGWPNYNNPLGGSSIFGDTSDPDWLSNYVAGQNNQSPQGTAQVNVSGGGKFDFGQLGGLIGSAGSAAADIIGAVKGNPDTVVYQQALQEKEKENNKNTMLYILLGLILVIMVFGMVWMIKGKS